MASSSLEPGRPYYSPCQASVYIGDVWIDDAADIQWEVRDEKTPIYGFADYDFRATLRGRSVVSGVLVIAVGLLILTNNFTRLSGYLGFLNRFAL